MARWLCLAVCFTIAGAAGSTPGARGVELLGYVENWVDVKWWDNNMPGNCMMGCFKPQAFLDAVAPYTSLNYGFSFLTTNPSPNQVGCGTSTHEGPCPIWDGENIYLAAASKQGSVAVDSTTSIDNPTPSIVAIAEAVRLAKMHPSGPKRMKIVLGGWSDFTRLGSVANGQKAAKLMAKFVAHTFADGIDIDMEHLTPFSNFTGDDEFAALAAFVTTLRSEFKTVAANWGATAKAKRQALLADFQKLQNWQKKQAVPYYNSSMNYLQEVASQDPPHLEISWTTRFNAFLPDSEPWNYLLPDSPRPKSNFATDNEGKKVWSKLASALDTVNVMAYDAGTAVGALKLNFETILQNFVKHGGVPAGKINLGFEPGEQAAGGVWEGKEVDDAAARYVVANGFGGTMLWAVNPSTKTNPQGSKLCPEMASSLKEITKPTYAWGPPPKHTKCDPTTGWWPNLGTELPLVV